MGGARGRRRGAVAAQSPQILIITGLSGSGKTHVARALEDVGWFCVDNLPTALIPRFVESLLESEGPRRSALVVDVRGRQFLSGFPQVYRGIKEKGLAASLVFLEASEKVLVRRFSETRRPHPLAFDEPVLEGIRAEREALGPIRRMADLILDTSEYTVHQLRDYVREHFALGREAAAPVVSVTSFGFKYGVPTEADLLFDVRFLPNPNFVPELRRLTGRDAKVVRYLRRQRDTAAFLEKLDGFLGFVLPRYVREGKSYLTIGIGCTGGRHRSVMVAESLARQIEARGFTVRVRHRDVKLA
jgi:UPF0042 nucleotide-binding protein